MAMQTRATPGVYASDRSSRLRSGAVIPSSILPPVVHRERRVGVQDRGDDLEAGAVGVVPRMVVPGALGRGLGWPTLLLEAACRSRCQELKRAPPESLTAR